MNLAKINFRYPFSSDFWRFLSVVKKKESNAMFETKKDIWKFIIQVLAAIITAAGTALGTTSCMGAFTTD